MIALTPTPELARPPPPAPVVDAERKLEATPKTEPIPEVEAGAKAEATLEPGVAPVRAGAEIGSTAGVAPSPEPVAGAAPSAEPAAAAAEPSAEPETAESEAEAAAPQAAAEPQPASAEVAAPGAAPPAALRVIRNPEDDPAFQAMTQRTHRAGARTKRHQTGGEGAEIAQGASAPNPEQDVNEPGRGGAGRDDGRDRSQESSTRRTSRPR